MVPTYFTTKAPPMTIRPNTNAANSKKEIGTSNTLTNKFWKKAENYSIVLRN